MAYLSPDKAKEFRTKIKEALPGFKMSITNDNYSSLNVHIMEGPIFWPDGYQQINHYHLDFYIEFWQKVFKTIKDIVLGKGSGFYDNSDSMTDYFDTAWYLQISIGKWDKPYNFKPGKGWKENDGIR